MGGMASAEVDADTPNSTSLADGGAPVTPEQSSEGMASLPAIPEQKLVPVEASVVEAVNQLSSQDFASLDLDALLQNTVVSATKSELKEDEAPAITTVITREEILRWGYLIAGRSRERVTSRRRLA